MQNIAEQFFVVFLLAIPVQGLLAALAPHLLRGKLRIGVILILLAMPFLAEAAGRMAFPPPPEPYEEEVWKFIPFLSFWVTAFGFCLSAIYFVGKKLFQGFGKAMQRF